MRTIVDFNAILISITLNRKVFTGLGKPQKSASTYSPTTKA